MCLPSTSGLASLRTPIYIIINNAISNMSEWISFFTGFHRAFEPLGAETLRNSSKTCLTNTPWTTYMDDAGCIVDTTLLETALLFGPYFTRSPRPEWIYAPPGNPWSWQRHQGSGGALRATCSSPEWRRCTSSVACTQADRPLDFVKTLVSVFAFGSEFLGRNEADEYIARANV